MAILGKICMHNRPIGKHTQFNNARWNAPESYTLNVQATVETLESISRNFAFNAKWIYGLKPRYNILDGKPVVVYCRKPCPTS